MNLLTDQVKVVHMIMIIRMIIHMIMIIHMTTIIHMTMITHMIKMISTIYIMMKTIKLKMTNTKNNLSLANVTTRTIIHRRIKL